MRKMRSFVSLCLLPELWSLKCQNALSPGSNKKSVPVWKTYLSAFRRSYLALSGNTIDYVFRSYQQQNFNV